MVSAATVHMRGHSGVRQVFGDFSDESKMGFKSSNFYRTQIRGFRCNSLAYCLVIALVTFSLYYLVYWRNSDSDAGEVSFRHGVVDSEREQVVEDAVMQKANPESKKVVDKHGYEDKSHNRIRGHDKKMHMKNERPVDDFKPGDRHDAFDDDHVIKDDDGEDEQVFKAVVQENDEERYDDEPVFAAEVVEDEDDDEEGEHDDDKQEIAGKADDSHLKIPKAGRKQIPAAGQKQIPKAGQRSHAGDHPGKIVFGHDMFDKLTPKKLHEKARKYQEYRKAEVDPDYRAVAEHNKNPKNQPKLPKFKPNKHINLQQQAQAVAKPHPQPKQFPVSVTHHPNVRLCPRKPFILVVVLSNVKDHVVRNTIRKTWGSPGNFHVSHVPAPSMDWWVVFAVGSDASKNEAILAESAKYADILQGDFVDMDAEETRKLMMAMKWITELHEASPSCHPAYLLKTNANVFINGPILSNWITNTLKKTSNVYAGKVLRQDFPIRDMTDPHYVPYGDFPDDVFPDMIRGPTVILSFDVVLRMVPLFGTVAPIAMDDSYIGVLASRLGVAPRNDERFVHMKRPSNVCHYMNMMIVFGINASEHRHVYNVIIGKSGKHCTNRGL
ncbi:uncharacterized protein [Diadema antillarum]|uniref:uncharacterized protein n=1 Tax=Diadema antillarum TaxID=105358 RepID=UPI003A8979B8